MSNEYLPPVGTRIPFNFTEKGYDAPNSTSVLFNFAPLGNFGTLKAAINVMQPYWYTTHTYPKECPKYVVGYGPGGTQIIRGRCTFGGIRDLQGIILGQPKGYTESPLYATINGILNKGESNLPAYANAVPPHDLIAAIGAHGPEDLGGEITPESKKDIGNLPAYVGSFPPGNITAWIAAHQPGDLGGILEGIKYKGSSNLGMTLEGTHDPVDLGMTLEGTHDPEDIRASIRAYQREHTGDISAYLDGLKKRSDQTFTATIGAHDPTNLGGAIRMWRSGSADLAASLKVWRSRDLGAVIGTHPWSSLTARLSGSGKGREDFPAYLFGDRYKGQSDLSGRISMHLPRDLGLSITAVRSGTSDLGGLFYGWKTGDLSASMKWHAPGNIGGDIRGWFSDIKNLAAAIRMWHPGQKDLSGYIDMHQPVDLPSQISLHDPVDLGAFSGGHDPGRLWIILRTWHRNLQMDLPSYLRGWQQGNMPAFLGVHLPRNLRVFMRAWQREVPADLPANLIGWQQGPDVRAEIGAHFPRDFQSIIRGWMREDERDLQAKFWGWEQRSLSAYLSSHPYILFPAAIRPWYRGLNRDLGAQVKMWQKGNLLAFAGGHIWGMLSATVYPHPPPPLPASIRGWYRGMPSDLLAATYGWGAKDLGATMGAHPWSMLNIIMKGVFLEAELNLPASTYGWQEGDLGAFGGAHGPGNLGMLLKGVAVEVTRDLGATFWGWEQRDLGMTTKGGHLPINLIAHVRIFQRDYMDLPANIHGWQTADLGAAAGGHWPGELPSAIRPWYRENIKNLKGLIYGWQPADLSATIGAHLPQDLRGIVKAAARVFQPFPASVWGWQSSDLGMTLAGTHDPVNLSAHLQVKQREARLLAAIIYGWQTGDLPASLNIVYPFDLPAVLQTIPPKDLSAYLKVHPQSILTANTYGWGALDLGARINQIWDKYLPAQIDGRDDMFGDLYAWVRGVGTDVIRDLPAFVRTLHWRTLSAQVRATYLADMPAYLYAIPPRNLSAMLHAWHERFLGATLNGQNYPWNLTASIYPRGIWSILTANIYPKAATAIYSGLRAMCHPYEERFFPASITGANALFLGAILNPIGFSGDLHAAIRPKMIRLTTVIEIPTMNHRDLSAIINYPCFKTGSLDLSANMYVKYKGDLRAHLRVIRFDYKPALLGAKTGYSDSYSDVDKLKLRITIYPNEVISEDKLRLRFYVRTAGSLLRAFLNPVPRHRYLSAYVVAEQPAAYAYPQPVKNREVVVHKTYDGIFKQYEYVEFAFKSMVKDYYYSSGGNYAWKQDRFERWMLMVSSYLPTNTSLRLKRRLHRATTLYDLRDFKTVDEAVKFAIAYVTEYPQGNLGASIHNLGRWTTLRSTINPRYIRNDRVGLKSNITAVGSTIVLGAGGGIAKI
jgi:hypothetical protein